MDVLSAEARVTGASTTTENATMESRSVARPSVTRTRIEHAVYKTDALPRRAHHRRAAAELRQKLLGHVRLALEVPAARGERAGESVTGCRGFTHSLSWLRSRTQPI